MMRRIRFIAAAVLLLCPAMLRAVDPFVGRWNLDVQRSRYASGACPKKMIIEMRSEAPGVHYHSETQLTDGRLVSADYTADYDERPVIVKGTRGILLPVSLKRGGPNVVIATYTSGFQVMAISRRVISAGGSVMTITTTSQDALGRSATNIGVYRRTNSTASDAFDLSKAQADLQVPK